MLRVYKQPKTLKITITEPKKNGVKQKTKTVSVIIPNKNKDTIESVKNEIKEKVVNVLTDNTATHKLSLQYRSESTKREGMITFKTNESVESIYDYFMNL